MASRRTQADGQPDGDQDSGGAAGDGSRESAGTNNRAGLVEKLVAEDPAILGSPKITEKTAGETKEFVSCGVHGIKTVDDLLRHIDADLTRFEVAASEATVWESASADGKVPLYRVWVRLKPKAGPGVKECVEAMIAAAAGTIARPAVKARKRKPADLWQVLVIADPHFGKYAWSRTAGEDYDLDIAQRVVSAASDELLEAGDDYDLDRRTLVYLGDQFHYDTPAGTTTGGTPLERDGRIQKMIAVGCDTLLGIIERSAETVPTDVVIVPGNHDTTLTWAFQRIAQERFRNDGRVSVSTDYTARQYAAWGKNLLGFAHGNKAKNSLPQLMTLERPVEWSRSVCREWHTGHLHHTAAKRQKVVGEDGITTIHGVVVRTAPTVCASDDYHYEGGWIGAPRQMETFLYAKEGGLAAMHVARV